MDRNTRAILGEMFCLFIAVQRRLTGPTVTNNKGGWPTKSVASFEILWDVVTLHVTASMLPVLAS